MATESLKARDLYDRPATMRSAQKLYRYVQGKGWTDWPFARCLPVAQAEARERRELSSFAEVEAAIA